MKEDFGYGDVAGYEWKQVCMEAVDANTKENLGNHFIIDSTDVIIPQSNWTSVESGDPFYQIYNIDMVYNGVNYSQTACITYKDACSNLVMLRLPKGYKDATINVYAQKLENGKIVKDPSYVLIVPVN
ncbi:MAG: hypothetical protein II193_05700 [Lachnospiraceae bacterium]|nr:hypothetical protein [Lachnospiraceae bacterium]